jgi:Na+/H+ antiporter NhaD/arsenite permease-like protein
MFSPTQIMIIALIIFVISYAFIIIDKIDKSVIAITGAVLMVLFRIFHNETIEKFDANSSLLDNTLTGFGKAIEFVDFNTIALLMGMMSIVFILKGTGVFEYLAIKAVKVAKGEPKKLLFLLCIITGLLSGFLDNVTTVLLLVPVTLNICRDLKVKPHGFIIAEIFASNTGGASTLIGDPPNILIGSPSASSFTFLDFILNVGLITIPILIITSLGFILVFRKSLVVDKSTLINLMLVDEKKLLTNHKLLKQSILVISITVLGFFLHGMLHYESGTIAVFGAMLLFIISRVDPIKIYKEVEWKTLLFFVGLFIIVGGLEVTRVIHHIADFIIHLTGGNQTATTLGILWTSALASSFLDNVPFVQTMIGVINAMPMANKESLWWALSLGACLGGNGTIIGAMANIISIDLAKKYGCTITFVEFFKKAFLMMIFTIVISSVYLYVFYLI